MAGTLGIDDDTYIPEKSLIIIPRIIVHTPSPTCSMATSTYPTTQYTSEEFVESSGAILFDLSSYPETKTNRVCLIHHLAKDEWLLAKGRRNCGESRREAALREVQEETGYRCHTHPVTMATRAPGMAEAQDVSDRARVYADVEEPFMLTIRDNSSGGEKLNAKLIWWFISAVDERQEVDRPVAEGGFRAEFFAWEDALRKLTFQNDRNVLERAISLVGNS